MAHPNRSELLDPVYPFGCSGPRCSAKVHGFLVKATGEVKGEGDFVISIEAPLGSTELICVRGCNLVDSRDLGIREPDADDNFGCTGTLAPQPTGRYGATVHGFVVRQ